MNAYIAVLAIYNIFRLPISTFYCSIMVYMYCRVICDCNLALHCISRHYDLRREVCVSNLLLFFIVMW